MSSRIISLVSENPNLPLGLALILVIIYVVHLHKKIHNLTRGQSGESLENIIKTCVDGVAEIEKRNELISKHAISLDTRVSHALRNAQTIRYKAFETNGSSQSFSIALLNEKGNGVVITSLHAHNHTSTHAKPVEKYSSTHELTEEELAVIEEARAAHKIK
ncbi:DUF4446 family protein [Candidatus Gracilibacteria bacterium]|nr:DUF4446 family protein [Candidatus Gracilibacteria bacterium]MCF7898489.1 DUF4446 family protein [Candidatus Paceibacterota bacterium]